MRIFCIRLIVCFMAIAAVTAQAAEKKASSKQARNSEKTATAPDTASKIIMTPADVFMKKYGKDAADSLEIRLSDDYFLCTGDTTRVTRDKLFAWKAKIDSMVMDKGYAEKFKSFIAATGLKAHEVRPCEPLVFFEQLDRQISEMDSIISAQRYTKEKHHKDSVTVAQETKALKANPADILNIPAGMSRSSVQTILGRNKIKINDKPKYIQVDLVKFEGITVTIAFYFDDADKFTGYEIETEALKAEQLDTTVRGWIDLLTKAYTARIGQPTSISRVSFRDIKQGQLSICTKWEKGESRPKVLIGLATHNYLYYAKVMVSY